MNWMRFVAIVAVATASLYGVRAIVEPEPTPSATFTQAVDTDETTRLISVFERRLEDRSDYPDLLALGEMYLIRARTTGSIGDHVSAENVLAQAVELAPTAPDALIGLARADLALHDFEEAADTAATAFQLDSTKLGALTVTIDAALALGDTDTARADLTVLAASFPDDPAVLLRQAELAWINGDVERAIERSRDASAMAASLGLDAPTQATFDA
jgi:tetratricopeptide (TPR) repeat protein